MKKIILLIVACVFMQQNYGQELIKIDYSDFKSNPFLDNATYKDFISLTYNTEAGIANVYPNSTDISNKENTIKIIRLQSKNISALNQYFNFSSSVEIIIIEISEPNLNIDLIDCKTINRFNNLKYIFYKYKIDIKNDKDLKKIKCLPVNIKQVYSKIFTT